MDSLDRSLPMIECDGFNLSILRLYGGRCQSVIRVVDETDVETGQPVAVERMDE
jgi:hypothetical protein